MSSAAVTPASRSRPPERGGAREQPADRRPQPLELQRAQLLARQPLAHTRRSFAFQLRSRFSTSAGLRWQTACSRA